MDQPQVAAVSLFCRWRTSSLFSWIYSLTKFWATVGLWIVGILCTAHSYIVDTHTHTHLNFAPLFPPVSHTFLFSQTSTELEWISSGSSLSFSLSRSTAWDQFETFVFQAAHFFFFFRGVVSLLFGFVFARRGAGGVYYSTAFIDDESIGLFDSSSSNLSIID